MSVLLRALGLINYIHIYCNDGIIGNDCYITFSILAILFKKTFQFRIKIKIYYMA